MIDKYKEWLEQVVIEDPFTAERIERILHPEQYEKTSEEMLYEGDGDRFAIYQIRNGSASEAY